MGVSVTFLLFYRNTHGGQTPQPIFTQNGSNDVDSRIDVPFAVKIKIFETPDPQNRQNLPTFGRDLENFTDTEFIPHLRPYSRIAK